MRIFARLAPVECFPALGTGCILFSRVLQPVAYFPTLGIARMFYRNWHRLRVFPRLALITWIYFAL